MKTLHGQYSLHELCAALGVTRSGYQAWDPPVRRLGDE